MTLTWTSETAEKRFGSSSFRFVTALLGPQNSLRARLLAWLAAATFSTMAVVALIGTMAEQGFDSGVDLQKLGLFALIAALVVFSQYNALTLTAQVCDTLAERHRHDMLRMLRTANLESVEAIGTARIFGAVERAAAVCIEAGPAVIHGIIALGVTLLIAVHLAIASPATFTVMLFFGAGTWWLYRHYAAPAVDDQIAAEDAERRYQSLFLRFLDSIRQVKLDRRMADDLEFGYLAAASADWSMRRARVARRLNAASALAFAGCYLILAAVVFAMPQYTGGGAMALKITYITIFLLATFNILMRAAPTLDRANAALGDLEHLRAVVGAHDVPSDAARTASGTFESIEAHGLMARGAGGRQLTLRLARGEIVAIEGRNGSGKTALLRALTGLDTSVAGAVVWNGEVVDPARSDAYRALFAAAFHDEPPADRLYGCPDIPADSVRATLERLGLDSRRIMSGDRIVCDSLSPALKRRLALALAVLRNRPVLVLDDMTREQDAAFRDALAALVREKAAAGTAIILTVTDGQWARQVTPRVMALDDSARLKIA